MGSYTLHSKANISLNASLVKSREGEVVDVPGRDDDFDNDMENGKSFLILGLVKEKFSVLFHT